MNNSDLQLKALSKLMHSNKIGVILLLNKYGVNVSLKSSDKQIAYQMIELIKNNSDFTSEIIRMMQELLKATNSNFSNVDGEDENTASIIAAALKGLGLITSTWQSTAKLKSDSVVQASFIAQDKRLTPIQLAGIIGGGIILLTVGVIIIIKTSKK